MDKPDCSPREAPQLNNGPVAATQGGSEPETRTLGSAHPTAAPVEAPLIPIVTNIAVPEGVVQLRDASGKVLGEIRDAAPAEAPRPVLTDAQRAAGWRETTDPDEFLRDIGAAPAEAPPAVDPYTKGFADGVRMLTETRLAASRERDLASRQLLQRLVDWADADEPYDCSVSEKTIVNLAWDVRKYLASPDSAAEQGEAK